MHPYLRAAAARQGGVFTAAQARAAGYTPDEVRARLESRRWVHVRRGIYREHGPADETTVRIAGAVLACRSGRAVASHRSAAHLHGLAMIERGPYVDLTLRPPTRTTRVKGCVVHQGSVADETVRVGGVPTTTAARTVVDLAQALPFRDAVVAADSALVLRRTDRAALSASVARQRGRAGAREAVRVIEFASARAGSAGESLTRVVLAEAGLPSPLLGEPVVVDGDLLGVVDFLWPEHRTVGEFDGRIKYAPANDPAGESLWLEKLREERLREAGFEVVRFTWDQVAKEPGRTAARVWAAFERAAGPTRLVR